MRFNVWAKWLLVVGVALTVAGCQRSPETLSGSIFGTFFEVTIAASERYNKEEIEQGVLDVLNDVDQQMSTYKNDSNLMELNRMPVNEAVAVPAELFHVLQVSLAVSEQSSGAFDNTVGGLVNLWGFGPEGRVTKAPEAAALETRLAEVGYQYVELNTANQTVTRRSDVFVDLSGVAKGYAVDKVSEYLLSKGIENFLVNIGGDLRASGVKSEDAMWRIGIEVPTDQRQIAQHILPIQDIAVLGSGDYRNYFEENGVRYSHTIDPTTGMPISHNLAAVHVAMPSATEADAWATAFLVLGEERGVALANERGIAALFIVREGEAFNSLMSEPFERQYAEELQVPTVL
ncbi:MAG: thiamine biosynthesis lipoprotein ApbE [Idiomarinaceae bacterium HL-53]|nr:MAG: thiamine biosynthesis lipoprotein ApbE [Idiomarinaceae bacterium HL-53]CUS47867.1 thiamine biosynthesis lipoprotein [Idiomarinaceae bacterium HL-53]